LKAIIIAYPDQYQICDVHLVVDQSIADHFTEIDSMKWCIVGEEAAMERKQRELFSKATHKTFGA
jgi:hypothetical protein